MKKIKYIFALILLLTGCSSKSYSFKDVTGFEIKNVVSMKVSDSVYQNYAWPIEIKNCSYLDCQYVLVDFDINKEFLSSWPPSEAKDDATVIFVESDPQFAYNMPYSAIFYISHNSHYMYARSNQEGKSFRSRYIMPISFIIETQYEAT